MSRYKEQLIHCCETAEALAKVFLGPNVQELAKNLRELVDAWPAEVAVEEGDCEHCRLQHGNPDAAPACSLDTASNDCQLPVLVLVKEP